MRQRSFVFLIAWMTLLPGNAQQFTLHQLPNDTISSVDPMVRLLPNGDIWMIWFSWDTRTNPWDTRVHVRRFDPAGQLLAGNDLLLLTSSSLWLSGAAVMPDGGVVIAGNNGWKGLYMRMDANAQLLVAKRYWYNTNERFRDVAVGADGMPVLVGWCSPFLSRWPWVVRVDPDGVLQSASSARSVGFNGMHQMIRNTMDGGMLVLGQALSGVGYDQLHIMKMDSLGQVEWGRSLPGPRLWPVEALQRADGGWVVLATQQVQDSTTHGAPVVFQVAPDGTIGSNTRLWAAPVGSTYQTARSMGRFSDGSLLVAAQVNSLSASALFAMNGSGVVAPWARIVPDTALLFQTYALPLQNGDLLLHGLRRLAPPVGPQGTLLARWDTAHAFPCGSATAPVLTDSITHGILTDLEHNVFMPLVEDIMTLIVPDTITWTVIDPCAISTAVVPQGTLRALTAWPNPTHGTLFLSEPIAGVLLDTQGRTVWSFTTTTTLPLAGVEPGTYILHATDGRAVRFMKQ